MKVKVRLSLASVLCDAVFFSRVSFHLKGV